MKHKFLTSLIAGLAMMMVGCGNYDHFDTVWTYDKAIMRLPNGEIVEGKVEQWKDYEGDVIQVQIDGNTYYIHMNNVVLISDEYAEDWDAAWPTMPALN